MFPVHFALEKFVDATISGHFEFVFGKNHMIVVTSSFFAKLRFQNVFGSHENAKPAFHILFDLNGAFETLRFGDRLV